MKETSHSKPGISIAAVIPVHNNGRTITEVVAGTGKHIDDIIVVNDGSTDDTAAALAAIVGIDVISFPRNRGKGAALKAGFARARERGFTHALTLDGDGQHCACDIPPFIEKAAARPRALIIGNRVIPFDGVSQPARSRFGARFSSFWYRFHTGIRLADTQCGFRLYPLELTDNLRCATPRFEFEIEILIKAAWNGIAVEQIPVHLRYMPEESRVSSFRPVRDFARVGVVNSKAALARIFLPWRFIDAPGATTREKILALVKRELSLHRGPRRAAAALAVGACVGLMPIHGCQVIAVFILAFALRLNRALAFLGVTISSPPFVPFWLALEYAIGRLVLPHDTVVALGRWLMSIGFENQIRWIASKAAAMTVAAALVQWTAGSIIVAIIVGLAVYFIACPLIARSSRAQARVKKENADA